MAHLLNLESVTVHAGVRTLLDGVSLGLDDGDRVGVVGRNGDGKSTLLSLLARTREADGGRVTHTGGLRVGRLSQADTIDGELSVRQAVVGEGPEHVWASDARVRDVLDGLLADVQADVPGGFDAPVGALSGGQRRRVALAHLLAGDHDLLLLDEPTNHLDVEGVAWLADHLRTRWPAGRGALVVVTHDRWFLDAVVATTWEVHDGVVDAYEGGYAAYVLARAERARTAAVTAERRENLLRKELAWLRRGAPARTSKPKFRLAAAEALVADEPPPRDELVLQRVAGARLGKDVLDVEGVTFAVGERVLLDDVTWRLGPGDRVGVVGANGAGKSTLLRLLSGELTPGAGRVRRGKTVVPAVLSQHLSELDEVAHLRVIEAVGRERQVLEVGGREITASQLVERLGFTKERAWTPVADLSGGERRRLQLARLLAAGPNVLLLDEPTNDLDTDTLTAVEDVLDGFGGTLVVVSHDRYLLERVCDRQLGMLGDGRLLDLPGGVEEYLALREATARPAPGATATAAAAAAPAGPASPAPTAGSLPAAAGASPSEVRAARKEMARIERQLSRLAERERRLHAEMAERATDHEAVSALDAQLRSLTAEREALEEEWLTAADVAG